MDGAAEKTNRLRRDISIVLGLLMMEDKATASTEVSDEAIRDFWVISLWILREYKRRRKMTSPGFHLRRVSIGDFGVPPSSSFVIAPSELQANPSSSPNHSRFTTLQPPPLSQARIAIFTAVVVEPRKSH
ncbi:hypothetical protein F2Q69_00005164 [Brassica cretica]|uniref:Uncharacterized protein n=1 Tax=Brassica cretica TaxID=69181 RepID=A0A8S9P330_BRACR|nr:hypothetical protein F2Q69_00005164 [Brassica cretica]